jgi:DMSO/TMAO reductase YedYZ molybdopterin-dependent catalytic subunit
VTSQHGQIRSVNFSSALVGGILAAMAAGAAMAVLRETLGVRTIPERVMEGVLLFVPPDLFEALLRRFGFETKRYALYAVIVGMLLILAALGSVVLRQRWSTRATVALGIAFWLFTMVVIMPLTSAGYFAAELLDGRWAAVGGYLAVGLTYCAVLSAIRALSHRRSGDARDEITESSGTRRAAVFLLGGAVVTWGLTYLGAGLLPKSRTGTRVVVLDPQEPVPSGGIDPPNPHPKLVPAPPTAGPDPAPNLIVGSEWRPVPTPVAEATTTVAPKRDHTPAAESSPATSAPVSSEEPVEPPAARPLARDNDGAVLPSGRREGELAGLITSNDDFYVVTKNAAGDPALRAADWRVTVDGDVQRPIDLDFDSLRKLPAVEVVRTLECISNFVDKCELAPFGCDLISTAHWKGTRLSDVLDLAGGLKPGVLSIVTFSADEFTTSLPIEAMLAPDSLLVYEMNGQPLPQEHGYPVRVLIPGRYGMKNAKWVVGLRPVRREVVDWYGQRNWSQQGIVKTMTRIDVPARGAALPPGHHRIAGIAYAGDRGIVMVEFSADDGKSWRPADLLEPAPGQDAWVRWQGSFTLQAGEERTLVSRATDGTGALQSEEFSLPQPNGSSGWHHAKVRATSA